MSVETLTDKAPDELDVTLPAATDNRSEGDDHLRLLKDVIKTTFAAVSGPVTATHTELNYNDITTLGTVEASKTVTVDSSKNCTGIATFSCDDISMTGSGAEIIANDTDGYLALSSGTALNDGSNIVLYGDLNAVKPNDIEFRTDSTIRANWENDGGLWQFNGLFSLANGTSVNDIDTAMAGSPTDNQLLTAQGIKEYVDAATTGIASPDYTSAATALGGPSSVTSFTHSLGAKPTLVRVVLRCNSADLNYSVGDEVEYNGTDGGSGDAYNVVSDTTTIKVITGTSNTRLVNKTTFASSDITPASWRLVVRAWA